jgi:hypothetical protein
VRVPADIDQIAFAQPDISARPRRRRRTPWVVFGVLLLLLTPLTWWQFTARTYFLSSGGVSSSTGVTLRAGAALEACTVAINLTSVFYVFPLANDGDHLVTALHVDPIFDAYVLDAGTHSFDDRGNDVPLPSRIAPHTSVTVVLAMLYTGSLLPSEHIWTGEVAVHFRVLGIARTEVVRLGDADHPQYIGLQAPDDNGHACTQPLAG